MALQNAKNRLSKVERQALDSGQQEITVRGEAAVSLIATHDLRRLRQQPKNLADFLLASPLRGLAILERDRDEGRSIEL